MALSTDYTGRTVDLCIMQGIAPSGDVQITTAYGDAGSLVSGIQKVVQSWLVLFLTERGTVLNKPTRGSSFITAVRRGRIQVEGDIPAEFSAAADHVRRTMELDAAVDGTLPSDERLRDAVLRGYQLFKAASTLSLDIEIRSVAGTTADVLLPVPISIK